MSAPFQTYFITKCVEARRPILAVPSAAEIVIDSLAHARRQGQIKLLAFVIMPDHYHAVFSLLPGQDLSDLMRRVGSYTAIPAGSGCWIGIGGSESRRFETRRVGGR
jgi:REP element-mobilizing transposase RayT